MPWSPKTLTTLQDEVFAALRDSERSFITTTMVTGWLNEAYFDLCTRLRIPESSTTGTTTASGTIALPAGLVEVKHLIIDGDQPAWVDPDVYLSYQVPGESTPDSVTLYRIFNNTIETYPAAESKAYTLEYIDSPTAVTDGTTSFTAIPAELNVRMVHYARAQAKLIEGEITESQFYKGEYERGLPDLPRAAWRRNPGRLTVIPKQNIFQGEWVR